MTRKTTRPMEATAQDTYNQLGQPRYYAGYGSHVDMRGVRMAMSGGPIYTPSLHVLAEVAEALDFIEARVEDEGELLDVLLVKSGFERFQRDWQAINPSRENAQDAEYIIEAIRQRRAEQAAKQQAARKRREQPTPWNRVDISHSGDTVKLDAEIGEACANNMICGVVDGEAVPFDPDDAERYDAVVAVTGPYPWGVYLSGPVLLVTSEDDVSVGQKVYAEAPRKVSTTGDTPVGRVIGTKHVTKRGEMLMVRFDSL